MRFFEQALASGADTGFSNDGVTWLPTVINIALHLFLVGSLIGFGYALVLIVREPNDARVKLGRYMGLFIGALIVVGAQASGSSYSTFIIDSLGEGRSPGFNLLGAVVPAGAGLALGYYLTRGLKRANERAIRLVLIVGTFCVTQFALMYAVAVEDSSGDLNAAVTPNVAFVVGIGLVMVLNLGVKDDEEDEKRQGFLQGLTSKAMSGRGRGNDRTPLVDAPRSEFHRD